MKSPWHPTAWEGPLGMLDFYWLTKPPGMILLSSNEEGGTSQGIPMAPGTPKNLQRNPAPT